MLDKTTLKTTLQTAFDTIWSSANRDTLQAEILAAFTTGIGVTDPTQAATARQNAATAIAAAVHKYVHGADSAKVAALATSVSDAVDTFVKGATITISPANVGLQTTTGVGAPTGGPAAPVTISGGIS